MFWLTLEMESQKLYLELVRNAQLMKLLVAIKDELKHILTLKTMKQMRIRFQEFVQYLMFYTNHHMGQ